MQRFMLVNTLIKWSNIFKRSWAWMILFILILVACNQEGVGGFAGNGSLASIVTNNGTLYTSRLDGSGIRLITSNLNVTFGTSLSPSGDQVVYMQSSPRNIIAQNTQGGSPTVLFQASNAPGILTFIPSGEVLYYVRESDRASFFILDPSRGSVNFSVTRLDQVFLSQSFFKPKLGSSGAEFIMRPYRAEELAIVTVEGARATLYTLTSAGLSRPTTLRRSVTPALQEVFAQRDHLDITSAVLSDDGLNLFFRTESGDPEIYSLYAIDLQNDTDFLPPLVSEWGQRPVFSISPDGTQVVFDCPNEGGSVCMYDIRSGQRSVLVEGASQPLWARDP